MEQEIATVAEVAPQMQSGTTGVPVGGAIGGVLDQILTEMKKRGE